MNKRIYIMVNILVITIATMIFCTSYRNNLTELFSFKIGYLIILFLTVIIVNVIKAFRFYFILVGNARIKRKEFLKQYCKTVMISILIPLKAGELFRIYCYGYQIKDYLSGIVYIILDRFFDTVALLAIIIVMVIDSDQQFSIIILALSIFVIAVIIIYLMLPKVCKYWNKYLLTAKATKNTLRYLKIVSKIGFNCDKLKKMINGKGIIVFVLSLIAWLVELMGVFEIVTFYGNGANSSFLQNYLLAALGIRTSANLDVVIVGMIFVLSVVYILLHVHSTLKECNKK